MYILKKIIEIWILFHKNKKLSLFSIAFICYHKKYIQAVKSKKYLFTNKYIFKKQKNISSILWKDKNILKITKKDYIIDKKIERRMN